MKYPMIRLSHSSADTFFKCAYCYEREKLIKDVPYTETEATLWGTRCHSTLEDFLTDKSDTLDNLLLGDLRPMVHYLKTFPADYRGVETEFCFNTSAQVCEKDDPAAMFLGYIDFEATAGDIGYIWDWKSGARHSKFEQVELYALSMWIRYPHINTIKAGYVWLKEKANPISFLSARTLYRATDMQRIWEYRVNQWKRIYEAHRTGVFQANPGNGRSKFPCGWCSVAYNKSCDFANVEYCGK